MSEEPRIIWSYTEAHLLEWMQAMHEDGFHEDAHFHPPDVYPDPASLAPEQLDEIQRRIREMADHGDFPLDGFREYAYFVLRELGIIHPRLRPPQ